MIDDAINGGFRGTFIIKGGQERGGDIVDVFRGLGLDWGFKFGRGCLQGGGVYSFFRDRSNGRMVEQEFFQNGGGM
jgi:hypothetical protein